LRATRFLALGLTLVLFTLLFRVLFVTLAFTEGRLRAFDFAGLLLRAFDFTEGRLRAFAFTEGRLRPFGFAELLVRALALGVALLFLLLALLVLTDLFAISSSPLNYHFPYKSVSWLFGLLSAFYASGTIIDAPYFGSRTYLHNYFFCKTACFGNISHNLQN
jgi:hypothetical protein